MLLIGCPGSALNSSTLARNFPVLERESGKLADPETDAAETQGLEEFFDHVIAHTCCKART